MADAHEQKKEVKEGRLANIVLTGVGLVLTASVFGLAWFFIDAQRKPELNQGLIDVLLGMELNEVGDFFAGFAAALAFIWLVIGYFLQSAELKLQRKELAEQRGETARLADEANRQSEAIAANEMHARRDTFMRVAEFLERDMYYHASEIYFKIEGNHPGKHELRAYGSVGVLQSILNNYALKFIQNAGLGSELWRLIGRYRTAYESLIDGAAAADPDLSLVEQFEWSPFGNVYLFLCSSVGEIPKFKKRQVS